MIRIALLALLSCCSGALAGSGVPSDSLQRPAAVVPGATANAVTVKQSDQEVALADAVARRNRSLFAQAIALKTCSSGKADAVLQELAAQLALPELRLKKGLRRVNSARGSLRGWCDASVEEYAEVLAYAGRESNSTEQHEGWIRFTMGDEHGQITPGGLARALAQRATLVRDPQTTQAGVSALSAALPSTRSGWTNLTGYEHPVGRMNDLLIHPTSTSTMWAGADGGGLWKTTDGGASWSVVNDFLGSLSISSIVMRSGDTSTLYVGTGAQGTHTGAPGAGIFKSVDGGVNWTQLAATDPAANADWQYVYKLAIHPADSNTVLAATDGGAYLTANGGTSWTKLFPASGSAAARNVAIHPANGNLRVIAMDDSTVKVATDGSTYHSYTIVAAPAPSYTRIALSQSDQAVMYALVNNGGSTQIFRSATTGASWAAVTPPAQFFYNNNYLSYTGGLWVDPVNPNHVAVVEGWGMVTADASLATPTWKTLCCGWVDFHGVVGHPAYNGTSNKIVFFMDDGGLYQWTDVDAVNVASPSYLAVNGITPTEVFSVAGRGGNVIFGAQDVSPRAYRSAGDGTKWRFMTNAGTGFSIIGDGATAAADRTNPNILYGSRQFMNLWRSTDGGATATAICSGALTDVPCTAPHYPSSSAKSAFIAPFVLDPGNQNRMLAGGQSLWRANDVSTGNPPTWSAIHSIGGPVITAIAVAPTDSNVIWITYSSGAVFKTANGTDSTPVWTQVTNVPAGNKLRLYIDRTNADRVFIGLSGFTANRLWVTGNAGGTWSAVSGLPDASVFSVQQHPSFANWIYVGNAVGLFSSEDGGSTWSTSNEGPANVQVRDLQWYADSGASVDLLVGTYGRGVWRATLNAAMRGDFNRDGKSDILWRHAATGQNSVWLMNGTTLASAALTTTVPDLNWQIVGSGDFNGDGKADILWRHAVTGQNSVWLMNGAALTSAALTTTVPDLGWSIKGVGDFNGDGKADILWRHTDGRNAIWLMNGTTMISGALTTTVTDSGWSIQGVGDFNGDGKADILWRHTDGRNAIWLMDGFNLASGALTTTVTDPGWSIQGVGDFNGDGKSDILWRHTNGQNAIWLMNGFTLSSGGLTTTVTDAGWSIQGVGDFNGDGKADILWRHTDGRNAIWLMNGTTMISGALTTTVTDTGWHIMNR